MSRSSTLARLTVETARSHAWIEEALFGPLEFPTAAAYRRFLCIFYSFQAPLESALLLTPGMDFDVVANRCKASRIANDLMALGLTRHEHHVLARRQPIEAFANIAQAFGWLYATERLMLRVETLRTRFENEMPVVIALANNFLYAYANVAELRWRQFGTMLDRTARAHGVEEIVDAARIAMDALQSWLTPHAPPRVAERVSVSA